MVLAAGAVILVAATAVAVWQLRGPGPLHVTVAGTAVDSPADTITVADREFRAFAATMHGAVAKSSRCYFDRIGTASGTDVAPALECGPVLLYASTPTTDYLSVPYDTVHASNGHLTLDVHADRISRTTSALPPNSHLERPDHRTPPPGTAGLGVPVAPPSQPNVLAEVGSAGIPALRAAPQGSVLGTYGITVKLEASGPIPFFGQDTAAHSAAPGQRLFAFVLDFFAGDAGNTPLHALDVGVSVDGATPRPLHLSDASLSVNQYVVASVPKPASSIDLVLTDRGITQRMSLITGAARTGVIAVYRRHSLQGTVSTLGYAEAMVDEGSGPITTRLQITVSDARLGYYVNGRSQHPSSVGTAFLWVDVCYQTLGLVNSTACFGFRGSDLRLTVPGRPPETARNLGDESSSYLVWEVPASFTSGVVTVTGSEVSADGRFRMTITKPFSFPVTFDAG